MYEASVNYKQLSIKKKSQVIYSPFESPLLKLVDFIYKNHTDIALYILRQRIHLNYLPSEFEKSLIKVCAKRLAYENSLVKLIKLPQTNATINIISKSPLTPTEAMQLALKHSLKSKLKIEKYKSNRQIGAVLLDSKFNLLSTGYNKSSSSKNQHAELVCLRSFWNKNKMFIPNGSKLFVTLKPCRMCSSLIYDFSDNSDLLEIFYLHNDPGPFAQNTILESVTKLLSAP